MTTPAEMRRSATAASEGETAARNSSNVAANTASNAGASALLAGLPGPLSGAATALSEGITAAIKNSGSQAKPVPPTASSLADPSKLFAAQLAFAIITAIWCFIKSILHPLPIIGMFFPLCSDEDMARDSAALTAPTVQPTSQAGGTVGVLLQETQPDIAAAGISFEQFLARQTATIDPFAATPRRLPSTLNNKQQQQLVNASPQTPVAGIVQTGSVVSDGSGSPRDAADLRKLFGL